MHIGTLAVFLALTVLSAECGGVDIKYEWTGSDATRTPVAGHPRPVPPSTAPAPAAAVGYSTQTFGPAVTLGHNWQPFSFFGVDPSATGVTQNANGSVTISGGGGNSYNAQVSTAAPGRNARAWQGIAFGGGGYFEATLSFTGPVLGQGGDGWPAFWAVSIEPMADLGSRSQWVEPDFAEFIDKSPNQYGSGIHNWYGDARRPSDLNAAGAYNTKVTVPPGTDYSQPHTYGWLWVPATATAKGYTKAYFDGVQVGPTITWSEYNGASAPGRSGSSPFSVMDTQHLALILGTGSTNPMTVYNVSVWQASDVRNLTRPAQRRAHP